MNLLRPLLLALFLALVLAAPAVAQQGGRTITFLNTQRDSHAIRNVSYTWTLKAVTSDTLGRIRYAITHASWNDGASVGGFTFDSLNGAFRWIPPRSGNARFTFEARDADDLAVVTWVSVEIPVFECQQSAVLAGRLSLDTTAVRSGRLTAIGLDSTGKERLVLTGRVTDGQFSIVADSGLYILHFQGDSTFDTISGWYSGNGLVPRQSAMRIRVDCGEKRNNLIMSTPPFSERLPANIRVLADSGRWYDSVTSHDFGRILATQNRQARFWLRNTGYGGFSGTIDITPNNAVSNGIFRASWPAGTFKLPPEQMTELRLDFLPAGKIDTFSARLRAGSGQAQAIPIAGRATADTANVGTITYVPRDTLRFGFVRTDSCPRRSVYISSTMSQPVQLVPAIASTAPGTFRIINQKSIVLDSAERDSVVVEFCPGAIGPIYGLLVFTRGNIRDTIVLAGIGAAPRMQVNRTRIDFDSVSSCVFDSVAITNTGNLPLRFYGHLLDIGQGFAIHRSLTDTLPLRSTDTLTIDPGTTVSILIRYCPTGKSIDTTALRIVPMNVSNGAVAIVALAGTRKGSGTPTKIWGNAPAALSFGDVRFGRDSTIVLRAINASQQTITIGGITFDHPFGIVGFTGPTAEVQVPAGGELTLSIVFTPTKTGLVQDSLTINPGQPSQLGIRLTGRGVSDSVRLEEVKDTLLDFGDVPIGRFGQIGFTITNDGNVAATISRDRIDVIVGDTGAFTMNLVVPEPVPANGSRRFVATFRPNVRGPYEAIWTATQSSGGELRVRMTGNGVATGAWQLSLEDVTGEAGKTFRMPLRIGPVLTENLKIAEYVATIGFDSASVYVNRVLDAMTGEEIRLERFGDSVVMFSYAGARSRPITGDVLCWIEMTGLSTGKYESDVTLNDGAVVGIVAAPAEDADAIVTLIGCEIGRVGPILRRAKFRSIRGEPGSEDVTVAYRAPAGTRPSLRVISIAGAELATIELPEGTGEEQVVPVRLGSLAPGVMFLELRVEGDRSVVPIMYTR